MADKFKPTKEFMLTPRPCVHCKRWMDVEFLAQRRYKKIERIKEAITEYYKTNPRSTK